MIADIYEWERILGDLRTAGFNGAGAEEKHRILKALGIPGDRWAAAVERIAELTRRGRILARFVTVYGLPPRLSRDETLSLHLAADFARGLRVLDAAEAADVASGSTGQFHTYLAMADGDPAVAQRLADAAVTRSAR